MADSFTPPAEVRANAKRGLELRREHGRGGTEVGVARARDLSNGKALPLETINRMSSYFARHEVDKQGEGWGKDSAGYIAWLLWGGDAGRAWVKSILNNEDKKDKAMTTELAYSYAGIIKQEKQADGTIKVYGKATDDSIDIDQQICDEEWLKEAMPHWFKTGGNIREQHSSIAAGVATDYEHKADDGHYITALIVDPTSVKKVEAGVLKGFSIGIRSPRVIRDAKAAGGRIVGGQIVEVSVVDRPANSNAKMTIAKAVDGELVEVAQQFSERPTPASIASAMNKYSDEQERDDSGRFGSGGGGSEPSESSAGGGSGSGDPEVGEAQIDRAFGVHKEYLESRQWATNDGIGEAEIEIRDASSAHARGDYETAHKELASAATNLERGVKEVSREMGVKVSDQDKQNVKEFKQAVKEYATTMGVGKSVDADLAKYSEDQERDESGRFGSGGGSSGGAQSPFTSMEQQREFEGRRFDRQQRVALTGHVNRAERAITQIRQDARKEGNQEALKETEKAQDALDNARGAMDYSDGGLDYAGTSGALQEATNHAENAVNYLQAGSDYSDRVLGDVREANQRGQAIASFAFDKRPKSATVDLEKSTENPDSGETSTRIDLMSNIEIANKAAGLLAEIKKFDEKMFNNALTAIGGLISVEGKQAAQGHDERESIKDLLKSLKHLIHFYRGEAKEGEVTNPILALLGDDEGAVLPEMQPAELLMAADGDKKNPFAKEDDKEESDKEESDKEEPEEDDAGSKEPTDEESDDKTDKEEMRADKSVLSDPETEKIIEKAVKSARIAVEEELELLKSANVQLEAERDEALNKAASGGPVRSGLTTKNSKHNVDDLLVKATEYRAKAANTEDRLLSAGYLELADDLESKARKA